MPPIPGGPGEARIRFSVVPAFGSQDDLGGLVLHVDPTRHRVASYIRVAGGYWTKPYLATPTVPIASDGGFRVDVTTGGIDEEADLLVAFVVPAGYSPALAEGRDTIPPEVATAALATVQAERRPPVPEPGRSLPGGPGEPAVELSVVPALGSEADLRGRVWHIDPALYRVATFIRVRGGYWTKPYWATPAVRINTDGGFLVDISTGGVDQEADLIVVFVVPADYDVPLARGERALPAGVAGHAAARAEASRTP